MHTPESHGIILFAHGSRDPAWREPFEKMLAQVASRHAGAASLAFLECMRPGLPDAIDAMVATGVRAIVIVPAFLATGSHVRKDLPVLIAQARERHPAVRIGASAAIGESAAIQHAIADFAITALAQD